MTLISYKVALFIAAKFENTKHPLPWNISIKMILMKFILSYSILESLYKAITCKAGYVYTVPLMKSIHTV